MIFITGYASLAMAIQAINGAAFAYLTKPFEMEQLLATVERAVEKQRLTNALRASEARYRSLVEGSIQGVLIHREFMVEFASPQLARLLGYPSADELIGRDLRHVVVRHEWARIEGYGAARRRGEPAPAQYEIQVVRRDGTMIWVECMMSMLVLEGAPATLVAVIVDGALAEGETVPVAGLPPRGSETVLVVEDEANLRTLAVAVLKTLGYNLLQASEPADAVAIVERHEGPIHLLVTDVIMPGMSGRELSDRLLPARPDLKTLFMSGYSDTATGHDGVLDPGTAFLPKPFARDALGRKVREVLDGSPRIGDS